jgi:hypothetical protein
MRVQAIAVCGGIHGDGMDTHGLAGADDADGDFAPVGDKDPAKHH